MLKFCNFVGHTSEYIKTIIIIVCYYYNVGKLDYSTLTVKNMFGNTNRKKKCLVTIHEKMQRAYYTTSYSPFKCIKYRHAISHLPR